MTRILIPFDFFFCSCLPACTLQINLLVDVAASGWLAGWHHTRPLGQDLHHQRPLSVPMQPLVTGMLRRFLQMGAMLMPRFQYGNTVMGVHSAASEPRQRVDTLNGNSIVPSRTNRFTLVARSVRLLMSANRLQLHATLLCRVKTNPLAAWSCLPTTQTTLIISSFNRKRQI